METGIQIFQSEQFGHVRTVNINGKPWFIAVDVCNALGIINSRDAMTRLRKDDVGLTDTIDKLGRKQQMNVINESGLYALIMRSDKPEALEFSYWVTNDVLPSIRKTGMYTVPDLVANPHLLVEIGQALIAEREKSETLEIALNESIRYYTVAKYNKVYKMGWSLRQCQQIGKALTAYCMAHKIEVRKCQTNDERFGETNSYPLTAWECFMKRKCGERLQIAVGE